MNVVAGTRKQSQAASGTTQLEKMQEGGTNKGDELGLWLSNADRRDTV